MAEGIRIVPRADLGWPMLADAKVCVTDHARPFPQPTNGQRLEDVQPVCSWCGKQHFAKTYHIRLYRGSAIVSTTVWEGLRHLVDNPFEYANPVASPPGQLLTINDNGTRHELIEKFVMPLSSPTP